MTSTVTFHDCLILPYVRCNNLGITDWKLKLKWAKFLGGIRSLQGLCLHYILHKGIGSFYSHFFLNKALILLEYYHQISKPCLHINGSELHSAFQGVQQMLLSWRSFSVALPRNDLGTREVGNTISLQEPSSSAVSSK